MNVADTHPPTHTLPSASAHYFARIVCADCVVAPSCEIRGCTRGSHATDTTIRGWTTTASTATATAAVVACSSGGEYHSTARHMCFTCSPRTLPAAVPMALGARWYLMSTLKRASVFPRDRLVLVPSRKKKEGEETLIASLSRRCRPFTVSTTLAMAVRVPRIPRVSPLARGSTTVIYDFRLFVETRCASDYSRLFSSAIFSLFFSEFARLFRLSLSRLDFRKDNCLERFISHLNLCQIANLSFRMFRTI